ncbi:hypothetical protein PcaKH15_03090 [Parageobacillus caldoxylosilyticus]|jgi:hypothetical protein|uniref:Uncharacterized protein n=1 Tax=Parageobacillus caldoxylosilyticus NBRC 107762 TaxID=1220594 RepID=A0A023DEK1_9BACL|nr:hypothetical protein PcaKH15_03090 [Parageobacillus caldoxylosilyticus]BDG38175.1 hypothetical protein PcaKH16_03140 [Parageobacillus caldoxylosilyticus]BDG41964.1 hypothetical protein PcaKH35_03090 [Parageobacillus caldoxylosilyticus]GAJ39663.1 hypothetical protein GCA01S_024_00280 [Parageobacillus caldoxylosilyticus NBRC 107762]
MQCKSELNSYIDLFYQAGLQTKVRAGCVASNKNRNKEVADPESFEDQPPIYIKRGD